MAVGQRLGCENKKRPKPYKSDNIASPLQGLPF
jgi:hypothetical protein